MLWILPDFRFPVCFWVHLDLRFPMCFECFRILYLRCVWILDFHCVFEYVRILKYAMATCSQQHTIHNSLVVYHSWAVTTHSLKWLSVGWTIRVEFLAETVIFLLRLQKLQDPHMVLWDVKCEIVPKHKIDWLPPFKNARL